MMNQKVLFTNAVPYSIPLSTRFEFCNTFLNSATESVSLRHKTILMNGAAIAKDSLINGLCTVMDQWVPILRVSWVICELELTIGNLDPSRAATCKLLLLFEKYT